MTIDAISLQRLCRERKNLQHACDQQDWTQVKRLDPLLMSLIRTASEDPHKDTVRVLLEVKSIIGLYREMTAQCRQQANVWF